MNRYCIKENKLYDNLVHSYIPFDLYWIVDLLNVKEEIITKLLIELED